jgi:hypothetical protein
MIVSRPPSSRPSPQGEGATCAASLAKPAAGLAGRLPGTPHPAFGHLLPIRCGEGIILWDVFLVPQGQPKIARSFNCGYASTIRFKSRRDGRSFLSGIGRLCRPSGTNPIGTQNPRLKPWAIIRTPLRGLRILSRQTRS